MSVLFAVLYYYNIAPNTHKGVGLETVSTGRLSGKRQVHRRVSVTVEFRPAMTPRSVS